MNRFWSMLDAPGAGFFSGPSFIRICFAWRWGMKEDGDRSGMLFSARRNLARTSALVVVGSAIAIAGCTSGPPSGIKTTRSKEYFAESEYGVKASPRVTNLRTRLPRGGGRDMVGKAYKVKGQWYKPKEEPGYRKAGAASWYGDAFHGRLTANGEIYDMTHLTAAHPTMPLPSYARVTNMKNGSSVIVRVNDRGPFARDRIIDLSKRAAEMLDYTHAGVAKVQVEYLGRAPLHGRDDQMLLASYRPGKGAAPRIDDGMPSGVMIAMNGTTPQGPKRSIFPAAPAPMPAPAVAIGVPPVALASAAPFPPAAPFPAAAPMQIASQIDPGDPVLPEFGPVVPRRPAPAGFLVAPVPPMQVASLHPMSYADERIASATQAFGALDASTLDPDAIVASWKRLNGGAAEYVAAATFTSESEAQALATRLSDFGRATIEADGDAYSVILVPDGRFDTDRMAELAWENGAPDAFVIRD